MTPLRLFAGRLVYSLADAAAWAISRTGRTVIQHELADHECEREGLPHGSTEPAVHVGPMPGMPWWRVDAWVDRDGTEHCWCLDALGWHAQVFYRPRLRSDSTGAA
jgi:hypothetical protein